MEETTDDLWLRQTEALGQKLAQDFQPAVIDFLKSDYSVDDWFKLLQAQLAPSLQADLQRYAQGLRISGFKITQAEITALSAEVITAALRNTLDVFNTWRTAPDKDGLLAAASRWSLTALRDNTAHLLTSVIRVIRDRFADEAFSRQELATTLQDTGFTGRRQLIDSPKGRRRAVHLQVEQTPNAGWTVPALPERRLAGYHFARLRENLNTRTGADRWSGSKTTLRYEWRGPDGNLYYVGTRGATYTAEGKRANLFPVYR